MKLKIVCRTKNGKEDEIKKFLIPLVRMSVIG